ncbi:MAG: tetratricopeptide repeat protein, partial [Pyrinomonadaceae bacterium]|nr:tetratricopeptide repeat protein [Pyrinomonadaceae bacterium]
AFIEGGKRLVANGQYEEAVAALSRALDVVPDDIGAIKAFVECQISLGYPEEAVKILEDTLEESANKKDIIYLLADCHLELDDPEKAEEVIVNLVVREPINYPKLFDLIEYYLKKDDVESAVRILSMVSEQVLVSAKSERLLDFLNEILARNPEQAQALRLMARYYEWNKEKDERQKVLEQLLEVSRMNELVDDERFALRQLVQIDPNGSDHSERLKEIHDLHGSEEDSAKQKPQDENSNEVLVVEALSVLAPEDDPHSENGFAMGDESSEEVEGIDPVVIEESDIPESVDSIKFYIEQGYNELAETSLQELIGAFGNREEFSEVCEILNISPNDNQNEELFDNENSADEELLSDESIVEEEAVVETTEEVEDSAVELDSDETADQVVSEEIESVESEADTKAKESSEEEALELVADKEEVVQPEAETAEKDEDEVFEDEVSEAADEVDVDSESLESGDEEGIQEDEIPVYGVIEGSLEEDESDAIGESEEIVTESTDEESDEEIDSKMDEDEAVSSEEEVEVAAESEEADSDEGNEVEESTEGSQSEEDQDEAVSQESEADEEEESEVLTAEPESEDEELEGSVEESASEEVESEEEAGQSADESVEELDDPAPSEALEDEDSSKAETDEDEAVAEDSEDAEPDVEDIQASLNPDGDEEDENDVYETHYHHAVAYKEMGLMEDAIREFQSAIKCIVPNDEDGKYLQCSTLLGHCFMEKDMPKLAVMWFTRAYEVEGLDEEEKQALNYELANAYEANGDIDQAREHFEEIYAFDVDYRDVSDRLEKVAEPVA